MTDIAERLARAGEQIIREETLRENMRMADRLRAARTAALKAEIARLNGRG
jgi:hypothetical protein